MTSKKIKTRDQIPEKYKWNLEAMYDDDKKWEKDLKDAIAKSEEFQKFKGHVTDDGQTLYQALTMKDWIYQTVERAYTYARMRLDEDNRVDKYQKMVGKASTAISKVSVNLSFFSPELLSHHDEEILDLFKECKDLEMYRFYIEDALRQQKHVLTETEENLLSQVEEFSGAPSNIFKMINNADIDLGTIKDDDGNEVKLTHGNYLNYMKSYNRDVRKSAFNNMYQTFEKLINTIGTTYNYNVKTDEVMATIRKYKSSREAALSEDNIPETVYDNLIDTVNEYLPVLHDYVKLRKKILGLDKLYMYDVYVPLFATPNNNIKYEEGLEMVKEGLAPLGEEYLGRLSQGIKDGWVDVYENEGKTSGAYSYGSYDSMPYALLNYTNTLEDVFTIVHELGHSMNSSYTREAQPYIYGGHSIFTAEVASTVNESLLIKHLINKEQDKEVRKYLLNYYIEQFRATLFRQTMFAEFEKITHEEMAKEGTITKEWMCEQYYALNKKYFGPAIEDDDLIKYEWARIPHFYRSFYVYQYATGFSAATAISKKILDEGTPARDAYLDFLSRGESDYPVELLKIAGIDMSKPEPIKLAMETFKSLVDELANLVK